MNLHVPGTLKGLSPAAEAVFARAEHRIPGAGLTGQAYHPAPSLLGISGNGSPPTGGGKVPTQQGVWVSGRMLWIASPILCTGWGQPCGQWTFFSRKPRLTCANVIPRVWMRTIFRTVPSTGVLLTTPVPKSCPVRRKPICPRCDRCCRRRPDHTQPGRGHMNCGALLRGRPSLREVAAGHVFRPVYPPGHRETGRGRRGSRAGPKTQEAPAEGGGFLMNLVTPAT